MRVNACCAAAGTLCFDSGSALARSESGLPVAARASAAPIRIHGHAHADLAYALIRSGCSGEEPLKRDPSPETALKLLE
jgi:hypothetical protein